MAVVQNTLIGKAKQSVGGTTFSTWKGINVLKSKAVSVRNPDSDLQKMRRSALTQIVEMYRIISVCVKKGWKKDAIKKSEYNAFSSYNLLNAFNYSSPPTATLILNNLRITNGTITTGNESFDATYNSPSNMELNWNNSLTGNQSANDEIQAVVCDAVTGRVKAIIIDKLGRSLGTTDISVIPGESFSVNDKVFCGFVRSDYSDASVSTMVNSHA